MVSVPVNKDGIQEVMSFGCSLAMQVYAVSSATSRIGKNPSYLQKTTDPMKMQGPLVEAEAK